MQPSKLPPGLAAYRLALHLYPRDFYRKHAEQQLLTAIALYRDHSVSLLGLLAFHLWLAIDLVSACIAQHLKTLWRIPMKRSVVTYSTILFCALAVFVIFTAVLDHTLLRHSANQPQQQMAKRYAARLSRGEPVASVIPASHVDLAQDLDPFVVFYNDAGEVVAGNGFIGETIPTPPAGVFGVAREKGTDALSWQPAKGVRIAMVTERVTGPTPGFVVVGRSLSTVEHDERRVYYNGMHFLLLTFITILFAGIMLTRAARHHGTLAAG